MTTIYNGLGHCQAEPATPPRRSHPRPAQHRRRAAALAGLAPHPRESGQWHGRRSIGGGRAPVRRALYMAALVAARQGVLSMAARRRQTRQSRAHRRHVQTHRPHEPPPQNIPALHPKIKCRCSSPGAGRGSYESCRDAPFGRAGAANLFSRSDMAFCLPMLSQDTVLDTLKSVKYPGYSRDIVSFGLVKEVSVANGVVNVAMVDGSIHSVSDAVDLAIWRAMATRNGNEAVSLPTP